MEFPTVKGHPEHKRRDFVFVSFVNESSVDLSTQVVHHVVGGYKVSTGP